MAAVHGRQNNAEPLHGIFIIAALQNLMRRKPRQALRVASGTVDDILPAAVRVFVRCCTWPRSVRCAVTRRCAPITNACSIAGSEPKAALIAVLRKMLTILNAMVR